MSYYSIFLTWNTHLTLFWAWGALHNDFAPIADYDAACRNGLVWC